MADDVLGVLPEEILASGWVDSGGQIRLLLTNTSAQEQRLARKPVAYVLKTISEGRSSPVALDDAQLSRAVGQAGAMIGEMPAMIIPSYGRRVLSVEDPETL